MLRKFAKPRFEEEFRALTATVGRRQPTPLESRVLPYAFRGRDLVVKTPRGEDITDALTLATLAGGKVRSEGDATLLLTAQPESVKNLARRLRSFVSNRKRPIQTVALGMDDNIKRELQLLSKPPDIIVGTPERLIDHMRRDNLSVAGVQRIVVDLPEDYATSGFDKDLLFIYSKLPRGRRSVLFCPSTVDGIPLPSLLRHPNLITFQQEGEDKAEVLVYRTSSDGEKAPLLRDLFFAEEVVDTAVICRSRASAEGLVSYLASQGITTRLLSKAPPDELRRGESALRSGTIRAVVSDSIREVVDIANLKSIIIFEMSSDVADYAELQALAAHSASCPALITLAAKTEPDIFEGKQEVQYVDTNNGPSNDDILKVKIRSIVKRIKEEEDPDELNRLRKIVRRNVPIFLRGYFMAYLLKESSGKASVAQDMKTLFVSIGKNRRVFPRDLSRLFSGALEIKASSIGNIKVLDNYSFIDIPEPLAQKAISMLDGKDFRGRKITVNHARKKEEE